VNVTLRRQVVKVKPVVVARDADSVRSEGKPAAVRRPGEAGQLVTTFRRRAVEDGPGGAEHAERRDLLVGGRDDWRSTSGARSQPGLTRPLPAALETVATQVWRRLVPRRLRRC